MFALRIYLSRLLRLSRVCLRMQTSGLHVSEANIGISPRSFCFFEGQGLAGTIVRPTEAVDLTSARDRCVSRIDSWDFRVPRIKNIIVVKTTE